MSSREGKTWLDLKRINPDGFFSPGEGGLLAVYMTGAPTYFEGGFVGLCLVSVY